MKLTARLAAVASLVNPGGTVADIGTDHAYLPAFLVLEGRIQSAIACDVRKMPLENAAETLRRFGLSDKISLRLSDGLDAVLPGEADEIVIAGIGGTLMTEILSRAAWLKAAGKHLVLQPQTHSEDVRRFLCENGFRILCEKAAQEPGHVYGVISAVYTGAENTHDEAYYYVGEMPQSESAEGRIYIKNTLSRLKKKAAALRAAESDTETVCRIEKIIKQIESPEML